MDFFMFYFLDFISSDKIIYSLSTLSKFRPLWPTPSGKLINLKILCRRDAATAFFASIVRDFHEFLSRIMMKIIKNERMRENHRNMAQFQQQKQTKNIENKIHFFEGQKKGSTISTFMAPLFPTFYGCRGSDR